MRQGGRFHLEDVVCHLSGRDTSLSWVDTPHQIPMQAKAGIRGDDLAVGSTGAVHQVTSRRDPLENGSVRGKICGDRTTFHHRFVCVEEEVRLQPTSTPVDTMWDTVWSFHQTHPCQFPTEYLPELSVRIREWSREHGAACPQCVPPKILHQ